MNTNTVIKLIILAAIAVLLLSFNWWGPKTGITLNMPDGALLNQWFDRLGAWGPPAVIGMMVVAILVSPLPSAPIALAAGAIYGQFWGTIYVLAGAEIGAIAAFCISRYLGYDFLHNWLGEKINRGLAGSQNFLMATVFASRLLPFISFDIVSYAAGLTRLSFWRFSIATFAGILPASFLLAYFGSELATDDTDRILTVVLILGAMMIVPLIIRFILKPKTG